MNIGWYYSNNTSPSDELVDAFADSKFGIDKWSSFAREIIQNSLDAQDDDTKPVVVDFDLNKNLSLSDIPDGYAIKDILGRCYNAATNKQTKSSYKVGLEVLNKEKVYCLKISDRNTNGVKTGRNEAWGAFIFDEGRSVKQRPGSAGSHGVGKKVPFIISACNTVFYATKNKYIENEIEKSDCLMQGKTALISWVDENGVRKNNKGWFGLIDENCVDSKNIIQPIDAYNAGSVNEYFLRVDNYGTDVIIIGVNIYENEEKVKKQIISAVLENFFVAILRHNLVVNVFGEKIDADSFETIFRNYYEESLETKNELEGCLRVFSGEAEYKRDVLSATGEKLGEVELYFGLGNKHNRKYYTIVRSHGMRITDYRINRANQPFTAVVLINGKELNDLLSKLENAAHDAFVTSDENMEIDSNAIDAINSIKSIVSDYICEQTKIDEEQGQNMDGLSNIISIPGIVASVKKSNSSPEIKRKTVSKKGMGSKSKDYLEGKSGIGGNGGKVKKKKLGMRKPAKKGGSVESILFNDYGLEPFFMKTDAEYILKLSVLEDIECADIAIRTVNSDGKIDDTVCEYIERVYVGKQKCKYDSGKIKDIVLNKDEIYEFSIKLSRPVIYQLVADVYRKELKTDE